MKLKVCFISGKLLEYCFRYIYICKIVSIFENQGPGWFSLTKEKWGVNISWHCPFKHVVEKETWKYSKHSRVFIIYSLKLYSCKCSGKFCSLVPVCTIPTLPVGWFLLVDFQVFFTGWIHGFSTLYDVIHSVFIFFNG